MQAQSGQFSFASLYPLETLLKGLFIFMSLFDMNYTLIVALAASLIGVFRVCKTPEFNQQYLSRVLSNNHGQNILYLMFGGVGYTNYLFFSPIALFFAYGIFEFVKIKFPANSLNVYGDKVRNSKAAIFQAKSILEVLFFAFIVITIPMDLFGRLIKAFMLAQFFNMKYKVNPEFRSNCTVINQWIIGKIGTIEFLSTSYTKLSTWIYNYANKDIQGQ
jgi:hypothetical protein